MEQVFTAIIGGGAAGLILGCTLNTQKGKITVFERGERLGRKLSATGNGQGNVTHEGALQNAYFTFSSKAGAKYAYDALFAYDNASFKAWLEEKGLLLTTDAKGRVYPAGRQASAVTDALRFFVAARGVDVRLRSRVVAIERRKNVFLLTVETPDDKQTIEAKNVVFCAGGKAAKNFGTDGSAYTLAQSLGHTVTPLYPSLVQLKTDVTHTKTLKGIRVNDGALTAYVGGDRYTERGDIIFTDYGVSGDAAFRISAFLTGRMGGERITLSIDLLPEYTEEKIREVLRKKKKNFPDQPTGELLGGIVNNQIGRAVMKRAEGDVDKAAALVKAFSLTVTGSLGFDYAQVTKGGIPLDEVDGNLQSLKARGVYFAGEMLDVDGECGGYNLQWAYSSARTVAEAINGARSLETFETKKTRGQV